MLKPTVTVNNILYANVSRVGSGDCSEVYSAFSSSTQQKVAIKKYKNGKPANALACGGFNHYGSVRDASETVFHEIQAMNNRYNFLMKFIDRGKINNNWVLIVEYIEGEILSEYFSKNIAQVHKLISASKCLGQVLKKWHNSEFAHGDPHLDNVLIKEMSDGKYLLKLIDYNMIHHPAFLYCQRYCCFDRMSTTNRYTEDLQNNSSIVGNGFLHDISGFDNVNNFNGSIIKAFEEGYH